MPSQQVQPPATSEVFPLDVAKQVFYKTGIKVPEYRVATGTDIDQLLEIVKSYLTEMDVVADQRNTSVLRIHEGRLAAGTFETHSGQGPPPSSNQPDVYIEGVS